MARTGADDGARHLQQLALVHRAQGGDAGPHKVARAWVARQARVHEGLAAQLERAAAAALAAASTAGSAPLLHQVLQLAQRIVQRIEQPGGVVVQQATRSGAGAQQVQQLNLKAKVHVHLGVAHHLQEALAVLLMLKQLLHQGRGGDL